MAPVRRVAVELLPKTDGKIASIEEIAAGVKDGYDKHPGYFRNDKKLVEFMRGGNWRKGPEILSRCQFYNENGWLPVFRDGNQPGGHSLKAAWIDNQYLRGLHLRSAG